MRKILLSTAATLLLVVLAIGELPAPTPSPKSSEPILNQKELRAWYDVYNRDYFGGHLTSFIELQWRDMHDIKRMGQTECLLSHCIITMDPTYNAAFPVAKATLLHEMCHVKTEYEIEDHGPKWGTCMDTLWVEGAFKGLI